MTERPKIEPVIEPGKASLKPKGFGKRLTESLLGTAKEEGTGLFERIIFEVIAPILRDTAYNIFKSTIDTVFYGAARISSSNKPGSYTPYGSMSKKNGESGYRSTANRVANNFDDALVESMPDAKKVQNTLIDYLEKYGRVSIGDLYDAAGLPHANGSTDYNWGWTDLTGMSIRPQNVFEDGRPVMKYRIFMPKVKDISEY